MTAISLKNLTVSYGATEVVHDVNLEISEGESFALVGESGSGKSTVLKAIAGLAPNWTGEIEVQGKPRSHGPDRGFASTCQMVFQDPYGSLHPRKTVDSVLTEALTIHGISDRHERVATALEMVGLGHQFRYRYPHQLSGGQRQRVAIARSLMLQPKVMLLDEPTSALDVSVQAEILNLLKRLRSEQGLTYLMVTHNLPVVGFMCDRMAVMEKGRIVEVARTNVLHTGKFSHSYSRHLFEASGDFAPHTGGQI